MIEGLIQTVDWVANVIGYMVLGLLAVAVLGAATKSPTNTDRERSTSKHKSNTEWVSELVKEDISAAGDNPEITHEQRPLATLDWSMDDPTPTDTKQMKAALREAGFHVHPFPSDFDKDWSDKHVGVWAEEPEWYVYGSGEKVPVTPNIDKQRNTSEKA